ncbi:hypothetical protein CMI37_21900 [Candidatus Pacearchaeota archaeon]|nr:hypothetical protein [Candidatus Pacearchaeota archaeon]
MSDKHEYEVEFRSTTWREYIVWAKSQEEAQELAYDELHHDCDVSKAWGNNADVSRISLDDKELFVDDGTIAVQNESVDVE